MILSLPGAQTRRVHEGNRPVTGSSPGRDSNTELRTRERPLIRALRPPRSARFQHPIDRRLADLEGLRFHCAHLGGIYRGRRGPERASERGGILDRVL
jgi:hypothetical protein